MSRKISVNKKFDAILGMINNLRERMNVVFNSLQILSELPTIKKELAVVTKKAEKDSKKKMKEVKVDKAK